MEINAHIQTTYLLQNFVLLTHSKTKPFNKMDCQINVRKKNRNSILLFP